MSSNMSRGQGSSADTTLRLGVDAPPGSVAFGNPATVGGRVEDLGDISTRVRAHQNGRRV